MWVESIVFNEVEDLVSIIVYGKELNRNIDGAGTIPALVYTINQKLEIVGIGSSDGFDVQARQLHAQGRLPFESVLDYLRGFEDSLYWWGGEKLVNKPTLINNYSVRKSIQILKM